MTAEVSLGFRQGLKAGAPVVLLVYVDHPDAAVRVWSGIGTLDHAGEEWTGIGALGRITGLRDTSALAVRQVGFELRGVPPEALQFLGATLRNRAAKAWLAVLDRDGSVAGDPLAVADALVDFEELPVGEDGKAIVRLNCNVGFHSIERALDLVWSHEQQQEDYPGDTGLSLISSLVDKEVRWRLT